MKKTILRQVLFLFTFSLIKCNVLNAMNTPHNQEIQSNRTKKCKSPNEILKQNLRINIKCSTQKKKINIHDKQTLTLQFTPEPFITMPYEPLFSNDLYHSSNHLIIDDIEFLEWIGSTKEQ